MVVWGLGVWGLGFGFRGYAFVLMEFGAGVGSSEIILGSGMLTQTR